MSEYSNMLLDFDLLSDCFPLDLNNLDDDLDLLNDFLDNDQFSLIIFLLDQQDFLVELLGLLNSLY